MSRQKIHHVGAIAIAGVAWLFAAYYMPATGQDADPITPQTREQWEDYCGKFLTAQKLRAINIAWDDYRESELSIFRGEIPFSDIRVDTCDRGDLIAVSFSDQELTPEDEFQPDLSGRPWAPYARYWVNVVSWKIAEKNKN